MTVRTIKRSTLFSASTLKLFACIFMVIDHVGVVLYPQIEILRIIGRLAYPIFAFFIAEGCRYTRNKTKRFVTIFVLGVLCETVYILYEEAYYGNILLTFSASILLIYGWQTVKRHFHIVSVGIFCCVLVGVYQLIAVVGIDYGFYGVLTPFLVTIFDYKEGEAPEAFRKCDCMPVKILLFTVGLGVLSVQSTPGSHQGWCLLAVPFLLLYNGKPGKQKFKYGFYVFYPLHLIIIELISTIKFT